MSSTPSTQPVTTIHNLRCLSTASPTRIRPGLLYRSAHLAAASPTDLTYLQSTLRVRRVIDLRSKSLESSSPPHGIPTANISLITSTLERRWLLRLSFLSFLYLIWLVITLRKREMLCLIAGEVLAPRGLVGVMIDSLDVAHESVIAVLEEMVGGEYPVLMHCQHGKDRTGVMSIVVLRLLGVPWEEVEGDYSTLGGKEWKVMVRADNAKMGLPEEFDQAPAEVVRGVKAWFDERGGVEEWCAQRGFGREKVLKLRSRLCKEVAREKASPVKEKIGQVVVTGIEVEAPMEDGLRKYGIAAAT